MVVIYSVSLSEHNEELFCIPVSKKDNSFKNSLLETAAAFPFVRCCAGHSNAEMCVCMCIWEPFSSFLAHSQTDDQQPNPCFSFQSKRHPPSEERVHCHQSPVLLYSMAIYRSGQVIRNEFMQGKRQMVVRVWLLRVCAERGKLETGSSVCVSLHLPICSCMQK